MRQFRNESNKCAVCIDSYDDCLIVGYANGGINIFNLTKLLIITAGEIKPHKYINAHSKPITAIKFNPANVSYQSF